MPTSWSEWYAPLIGRIFVGGFFLWDGILNTLNFSGAAGALAGANIPQPVYAAIIVILIEVLCGAALIVGWQTRFAALVLAIYSVLAALFHANFNSAAQVSLFLQYFAIVGGLLYISAFGSGSWNFGRSR
ncbi:MAG: DoxX family protein [Patescibacteria group bacterium]|nr:DoxX family protein [Patescibacteria group bacterium]